MNAEVRIVELGLALSAPVQDPPDVRLPFDAPVEIEAEVEIDPG